MRMIKTYNFILKTEIVDKYKETIMNEKKTDGVHDCIILKILTYSADRKVLFYLYCCN